MLNRSKRRQLSSGRSLGNLDPVEEEFPLEEELRDFKLRRLSNIGPTPGWFHFCLSVVNLNCPNTEVYFVLFPPCKYQLKELLFQIYWKKLNQPKLPIKSIPLVLMRSLNQYTRKYPEDIADSSRVAYG
jgi:hypothetical protein